MNKTLCAAICAALCPWALALDLSGRDASVRACDDFYSHVNGAWDARTVLPPDRARMGSFDQVRIANDRLLEKALVELAADQKLQTSANLNRLALAFQSGMDEAAIGARGLAALQPWLERIDALKDRRDLPRMVGDLLRHGVGAPLLMWVGPDTQDVRRQAVFVWQGGLGLPDRDDYQEASDNSRRLMAAYRQHAGTLLRLGGFEHSTADVDALIAFEAQLAKASMPRVQLSDPQATHNRRSLAALDQDADAWRTQAWLQGLGLASTDTLRELIVGQPQFLDTVARLAREAPLADWQRYLRVRLLDRLAPQLPPVFEASHFEFHEKAVRGIQQPPRRAERVIRALSGAFGNGPLSEALGELYVKHAFSAEAQQRAIAMVEDIRQAMRQRIRGLPWMSQATQQRALAKLDAMGVQIGAPAAWRDLSGLVMDPRDAAGNALRLAAFDMATELADLTKPVDRSRWDTSPHVVNAFAASLNRIVFPAGILQPPFFDPKADDAVNYGAIGMVIGHEITHHFDNRGRQYDEVGNLADWWTAQDAAAYTQRADAVAALYSGFEAAPGEFINGRQMLGENISDLGGLQIAHDGLQIALARDRAAGRPSPSIDGLTPEQRFFTANAVVWRSKQRHEALLNQLRTGQHSPGPFRVRGPMTNLTAFAKAFGCKPGDPMAAQEPISIW
jgi:putative endopeptidase